jgi:Predicted transcriptional regulator
MTASERREEILCVISDRRSVTERVLAERFSVNIKTIRRDIELLSCSYPLYTVQGNGGGNPCHGRMALQAEIPDENAGGASEKACIGTADR